VHLVWTTFERNLLITEAFEERLWALIVAQVRKVGATPMQVGGMPDHVHLLAAFPPALAIARLVADAKGASSFAMTHEFAPGRPFRWQEGYGAFTLRKGDVASVARYVANQKQHHASRRLSDLLEHAACPSRPRPGWLQWPGRSGPGP